MPIKKYQRAAVLSETSSVFLNLQFQHFLNTCALKSTPNSRNSRPFPPGVFLLFTNSAPLFRFCEPLFILYFGLNSSKVVPFYKKNSLWDHSSHNHAIDSFDKVVPTLFIIRYGPTILITSFITLLSAVVICILSAMFQWSHLDIFA